MSLDFIDLFELFSACCTVEINPSRSKIKRAYIKCSCSVYRQTLVCRAQQTFNCLTMSTIETLEQCVMFIS